MRFVIACELTRSLVFDSHLCGWRNLIPRRVLYFVFMNLIVIINPFGRFVRACVYFSRPYSHLAVCFLCICAFKCIQVDMLFEDDVFWTHPRLTNPNSADLRGYWWTCVANHVCFSFSLLTLMCMSMMTCVFCISLYVFHSFLLKDYDCFLMFLCVFCFVFARFFDCCLRMMIVF